MTTAENDSFENKWLSNMVLESWEMFEHNCLSLEGMVILGRGLKKLKVFDEMDTVIHRIHEVKKDAILRKTLAKNQNKWDRRKLLEEESRDLNDPDRQKELQEEEDTSIQNDIDI